MFILLGWSIRRLGGMAPYHPFYFLTYTSISLAAAVATEASSNPSGVSLSSITIGFLVSARVPPLSPSIRNYSINLTREQKSNSLEFLSAAFFFPSFFFCLSYFKYTHNVRLFSYWNLTIKRE